MTANCQEWTGIGTARGIHGGRIALSIERKVRPRYAEARYKIVVLEEPDKSCGRGGEGKPVTALSETTPPPPRLHNGGQCMIKNAM